MLGMAEPDCLHDHIQQLLKLGRSHGRNYLKEILDAEMLVRGAIQDQYLSNGGDLDAAISTVYSNGIAREIWSDHVLTIDPDSTYKKSVAKSGSKLIASADSDAMLVKLADQLSSASTGGVVDKGPSLKNLSEEAMKELKLTWKKDGKEVCYAKNLSDSGCVKKGCTRLCVCCACLDPACPGLRKGHTEKYAMYNSYKNTM